MRRKIILAAAFLGFFCLQAAWAGQYPAKADRSEGLLLSRVDSVGMEDHRHAPSKRKDFTPGKVRHDLVGQSIGPEAVVNVKTNVPGGTGAGHRSGEVYVSVPMGIVFDETGIMDVRILDVKKDGGKAALIVYVETVSSQAGKLRLHYEHIVDEWILREIENLSFKAR